MRRWSASCLDQIAAQEQRVAKQERRNSSTRERTAANRADRNYPSRAAPMRHAPEQIDELMALIEAQNAIAQAPMDRRSLMQLVADQARLLTRASGAAVAVVAGRELHYMVGSGRAENFSFRVPIEGSLAGLALTTGQVLLSADTDADARAYPLAAEGYHVRSMSVAPLSYAGEPLGVLIITADRPGAFGEREVSTLRLVSGLLGPALGHADALAQLARAEADARATAQQLGAVLRAATEVAIIGVDTNGSMTFFGNGAQRMLGYQPEEVIGRSPMMFHDPEEVKSGLAQSGGSPVQLFLGAALQGFPYTREWWYVRKDGSRLVVSLTITPMHDEAGALVGFIGVASDITERKVVDQMKDEFISIVSHEMRTPLTGIRASLGLLANGLLADNPGQAQRLLDIALSNTDRLVRLVTDMLDLDRMQHMNDALQPSQCDLEELMSDATALFEPMAAKAHVRLVTTPLRLTIAADRDRIVQVLSNLLSNAIKFSSTGGTVYMDASKVSDYQVRVFVRDQGRGIPEDQLERIFERFRQVDSSDSRAKGGSGLGLAISKLIVEQHGGQIWATSSPSDGTVFTVELPIAGT